MDAAYGDIAYIDEQAAHGGEWGVGEWPEKGSKAAWYAEVYPAFESGIPNQNCIIWHKKWHNQDGTWSDLRIDSSPEPCKAYREAFDRIISSEES